MASFSLDEFVGRGALFEILDKLVADGWDDVPTLKVMDASDMESLGLTQQQRDALDIRTYLHNRALMDYADTLEASGLSLPELINTSPAELSSKYGMKRGHVARFVDRGAACGIMLPPELKKKSADPKPVESAASFLPPAAADADRDVNVFAPPAAFDDVDETVPEPTEFQGIVASLPAPPRMCGFVKPPPVLDDVTPLNVLEKINVVKVAPEYKNGADPWKSGSLVSPPPSKLADLWQRKPTLLFCIRRPGCIMCRAEAHQLYSRKPIFTAMGVQLVAVLNEFIEPELRAFWPRYWGGQVVVDTEREIFRAMGGGKLLKEGFVSGFLLNPLARKNYKRAQESGLEQNFTGEGTIKGGLYILRPGKGGVAYQFVERTFGDWAPVEEVVSICKRISAM